MPSHLVVAIELVARWLDVGAHGFLSSAGMIEIGGCVHDYSMVRRLAELDLLWDTTRERQDSENISMLMTIR